MYNELINNYNDIEQFAAIAAHDLRSPLHNITALIDFFLEDNDGKISEDGLSYLNHVKASSHQLTQLIDSILEYSKSTQVIVTQMSGFCLQSMIRAIVQLLKPPANVTISFDEGETMISTSKVALKQVFLNLINNAIKYNTRADARINITFSESESHYHFSIADNGPGIPKEHLDHIFDLFKTVKLSSNSGTGIGLSIVKRLIKKLNGDISVVSNEGEGTEFIFTIRK